VLIGFICPQYKKGLIVRRPKLKQEYSTLDAAGFNRLMAAAGGIQSCFASVDFDNFRRPLFGGRPARFHRSWPLRGLCRGKTERPQSRRLCISCQRFRLNQQLRLSIGALDALFVDPSLGQDSLPG
jgi:hypothetical protein